MASPQHRTPQHRRAYQAIVKAQAQGRWLTCMQPICIMDTRDIPPTCPADVCHDDSGTIILGPGHARCNRHEAGKKRHRIRRRVRRWPLSNL
jgi:hypothetical protein